MKAPSQILLRPLLTEKSLQRRETLYQYSFEVSPSANKVEIRNAVEKIFSLPNKVLAVRTVNVNGKYRRRGRKKGGYRPDWKKAIVKMVKGIKIPIFEEG
jgi:large subunit ribosomal protein L23